MADSEILRILKDIPTKIQTASLRERREVLKEICNVLDSEGITEQVVRYICRVLPSTLHRYRDTTSQSYVRNLLSHLTEKHKGWALTCLPPVLLELSELQSHLTPSKYTSRSGIYALRWSTTLVESGLKVPVDFDVDYAVIILAQANLFATVTAFGNLKTNEKAHSALEASWRVIPQEIQQKWLDTLVAVSEPSPAAVVMLSALCRYYTARGERDKCLQHKSKMLELFTKSLINVKSRPNSNHIKSCKDLLGLVQQEDLKDIVLPALHKALLRSPEIIIEAVGEVFATLSLELNETVVDVGKSLIGNLQSTNETVREAALITLKRLSDRVQCTRTAEALLKYLFAFYNGVSGKLTSPEHKIAVLNGAGILSTAGVGKESVTSNAHASFVRVLEAETHERTLCAALQGLAMTKGPHLLHEHIQLFQKNLGLKSSTPLVRIAYMQFLAEVVRDAKVDAAVIDKLWPILTKSIEKAVQQPLQQFVVSEAISAMRVLVQLDVTRALSGRGASSLPLLLHERSLLTTPDVLIQVAWLCASILEHYPAISSDKESPVYRATIITLLASASQVRTASKKIVKQLFSNGKNSFIAKYLVLKLNEVLDEGKVFLAKEKSPSDDKSEVTGKMILDCVDVLCSCTECPKEDLERLVIEALPSYHHPLSISANRKSWLSLVKRMHIDVKALVRKHAEVLKKLYISGFKPKNETVSNIVSTLVSINSDVIVPTLVQTVLHNITDPSLLKVTRDEYFTYLTPEDELYDKSVVPGNENSKEMNLKRESKAYSYKDQLEELQLRRELDDKRKKEGKQVQVQLSAKQKEAIKAQQAKESLVRERLTALNNQVLIAIGLTESAFLGAPVALSLCMRTLLPPLLSSLQSPLAAPLVVALHVRLRRVLPAQYDMLAHTTARVTLRLYKPQCDLDPSWDVEPLIEVTSRTILMLQGVAATLKSDDDADDMLNDVDDEDFTSKAGFNAPSFCYIFPLLDKGLTFVKSEGTLQHSELILAGVQLLSQHGGLRATVPTDPYNPKYLPLDHMFRLLLDLIGSTDGRTQTQSVAALLDVASAASGSPGCCRATIREIDVLLQGLQHTAASVRDAALCGLQVLTDVLPDLLDDPDTSLQLTKRLLLAKFDVVEENRLAGEKLYETIISAELEEQQWEGLHRAALDELQHPAEPLQHAAAAALAHLLEARPRTAETALDAIMALYDDMLPLIPAKQDQFGHIVVEAIDNWPGRRGAALALSALAHVLDEAAVSRTALFLVNKGLADRERAVREHMLRAAMALVDEHGKATISSQLPIYENFLDTAPKSGGYDAVRQSVVLIIGALAKHLEPDDARIRPITLRLVASLNTPSQQVQEAVGNSLPHLVTSPVMKEEIPAIVAKLMKQLLTAEKYGDRKGASYGIAGIVKGLGILALKQLDIMTKLTEAIQEKKNYKFKEGALFALEMLCLKLGRLFEPYIVHVLPHLLLCFGDGSQYVRTAADDTAKLIMSKLSAHGVKLVLPSLLQALHDDNWRTKTGSIELLGAMAYCAPKQLSSCLPSIVPKLIEVLSDSHTKVQAAAAEALRVIGSVIRNPEIQAIVPVLLHALQDPSNKTSACLQTLLDTKFVHFIDAPSLALIMPVVQRAFLDRSTETRKMAAQIIGNMYSLTDQKDLMPYLPSIIPGLKTSLLDPVPEVRSVSARALGAMVRGMGEQSFEELLPWLMQTLTSEASSVDRSGAAQGLSEVVAGLGVHKLHDLMPDIISTAERTDIAPHVKDGYIMMFIYMPGAFTTEFTHYIGQIINPILQALADENEYVRETALKAGQRIVTLYADSAITLLLPELEKGLFDDNWRIRYSSVQLLGDLLYRISGVSGKMSTETACEDDNFGTEQSHQAIMRALGAERRNRVLAGLYMGRSDVALMVRQAALHVWKVVVTNTPKTLREILPTLFGLLLGCLASTSYDKRQVAARTLGDLVRKLGERVLPEIVPILERGLLSDRPDQRQGVCIGLGEIIASTSRDTVLTFADGLVPTVRKALCDPLPEVRMAAAKTFDSLHATIGSKALDDILPVMLEGLHDPDVAVSEATLDGLKQVMAIKSRAVLPYLIPQLTSTPPNTRALSALASAAGDALVKHLHKILPALLLALEAAHGTARETKELENCRGALLPVTDESGVRSIVDYLLESTRSTNPARKRASTALLCAFVSHTRADLAPHVTQLLRGLIHMMAVRDQETLQMAWEALNSLTKSMDAEQQIAHVSDVRQAVRFVTSDLKGDLLPGFCLPKGIAPILPMFRESILNGMPDDKESAAIMLGEIIKVTAAASIQPSVVHVTGPLIRILGDRFNANVKAAVLETLAILLAKVGAMLKQFLPQLQTTFLKSLTDPSRSVRMRAGGALSHLVVIHTRADPLFVEVHNGIKNSEDVAVRETMLQALRNVVSIGGIKMTDPVKLTILTTLTNPSYLAHADDLPRGLVGGCLGSLLHCLPPTHLEAALVHHVLATDCDWPLMHGRSCALFVCLKEKPSSIYLDQFSEKIHRTLQVYLNHDKIPVVCNGVRSLAYLISYLVENDLPIHSFVLTNFAKAMSHQNNEVKQLMARACATIPCARSDETARTVLGALLPALLLGARDKNSYVRANAELGLCALNRAHPEICNSVLDESGRAALAEAEAKATRRGASDQPEELDHTILT